MKTFISAIFLTGPAGTKIRFLIVKGADGALATVSRYVEAVARVMGQVDSIKIFEAEDSKRYFALELEKEAQAIADRGIAPVDAATLATYSAIYDSAPSQ